MGVLQVEGRADLAPTQKAISEDIDQELLGLLKRRRRELADAAQVPAYVIVPDKTLLEMAAYYPMSAASLSAIYGIGRKKLETYGQAFLEVIQAYCKPRGLGENPKPQKKAVAPPRQYELKPRELLVGEKYNAGETVADLAVEFQVQPGTILEHLTRYALKGNRLCRGEDLSSYTTLNPAEQKTVLAAFSQAGAERLKPVFEALNETVNYDELKILRLIFLSQEGEH
jgi:ATP-dependent DNA helicase RecQ